MNSDPGQSAERDGIYICYRNCAPDTEIARSLHWLLSELGFKPFFDKQDTCLNAAQTRCEIAHCIEKGLDRSQALIGIVSPNSFSSPWISYEIGSARGRKRFASERSRPPKSLKHAGESVCIAHIVCEEVTYLPDFFELSTLVDDFRCLGDWLHVLCEVCDVVPARTVQAVLTVQNDKIAALRQVLPPQRRDDLVLQPA